MKIGVSVPPVTGSPVDVAVMARRAEDLGFESIWVPEHPIMPLKSISLYPPPAGLTPQTPTPTWWIPSWPSPRPRRWPVP